MAPDSFGGTLTAGEAAAAMRDGWQRARPDDEVSVRPMSDGGPGFIEALAAGRRGRLLEIPTVDPLGRAVTGRVLVDGDTGYVESADAAGLHLLAAAERDPARATTYGVGTLALAAVEAGARTVVVGLGGSATNDGGAGLLAALGVVAQDAAGIALPLGGLALLAVDRLRGTPLIRDATIVAATDVDSPLCGPDGASVVFGPQKGAGVDVVRQLDLALERFGAVLQRDIPTAPPGLIDLPGAGAAGGMGAAVYALGGRRTSGFDLVATATELAALIGSADLVITGEGSFDEQSVRGKVPSGVAGLAQQAGLPCVVLAGRGSLGRRQAAAYGFDDVRTLVEAAGEDRALHDTTAALEDLAEDAARAWGR